MYVIIHEDTPIKTQANLYYELGVAQALGKKLSLLKHLELKCHQISIDQNT
ncbi:hypothetical protein BSPWISOXPB_3940 [uncultured Gammaproteobacteria bacterium]|nr:hypothetical protein BSPWISOXPB_3940 [uncultured Gammaproteobacteria bacterium]